MNKPPSLLWLAGVLLALALFGVVGAKYMLKTHSSNTMSQLGTVWPQVESMPEQDKNFLVELALTCNLSTREAVRAETVDCLRSAADKLGPEAKGRLEGLLRQGSNQG
ncbi:hypothetical protein B0920_11765 [Massilia sp. KIM]|uniref:hypothetical protein n=1 Tax=Massilia sp. KIM TaxID=1955422 RepID=UPI00098F9869|nr:hypothetical protein [Massilia sp. KIM]OON63986.1 hypothetical protein B0920_11765 [Massilia sp. KIM]